MIPLTLAEVAEAVGGTLRGPAELVVRAVSTDSRALAPAALFVALRGEERDGHVFVTAALDGGAVAVLAEREQSGPTVVVDDTWQALASLAGQVRRRVDPAVVAVTGSVGKTTAKDLTAAALGAQRRVVAARGSYNNELGVPLTLLELTSDTEALVTEIGARREGDIARLAPLIAPEVAVVTAVAGVHLEVFGSLEAVARAKRELVAALDPTGTAVLNGEDPLVSAMADTVAATALRYAVDGEGDVTAMDVRLDRLARASFTARTPWGEVAVRLPVAGRHQVGNALAALSVAGVLGVDLRAAATALAGCHVSAWRGEVSERDGLVVLNDAYNANPTSMLAGLQTLVAIERPAQGRTWAVLGVMAEIGEGHEAAHRDLGRAASEIGVDHIVAVGVEAAPIREGATDAGHEPAAVHAVADADAVTALLADRLGPGDVVLVKASRVGALEQVAAKLLSSTTEGRDR